MSVKKFFDTQNIKAVTVCLRTNLLCLTCLGNVHWTAQCRDTARWILKGFNFGGCAELCRCLKHTYIHVPLG